MAGCDVGKPDARLGPGTRALATMIAAVVPRANRWSDAGLMRTFALFRDFTRDELTTICGMMRRLSLPAGSIVCAEGGPGGSCFFLLRGVVGVTV